jgi:ubiquinone/menaquinone biosynthesis C-methylase UbiE
MNSGDHVALLRGAIAAPGGAWADLGSGSGAFTIALAELIGPKGRIYSVDSDASALRSQEREMRSRFPLVRVELIEGDFNETLDIPSLDGIVMANTLHFQTDACAVLTHVARWLKPGGKLIVVEYDIETPNPWVPHPLPYSRLPRIAACAGLEDPLLLGSRPSRYHRRVYSAVCAKPA